MLKEDLNRTYELVQGGKIKKLSDAIGYLVAMQLLRIDLVSG